MKKTFDYADLEHLEGANDVFIFVYSEKMGSRDSIDPVFLAAAELLGDNYRSVEDMERSLKYERWFVRRDNARRADVYRLVRR